MHLPVNIPFRNRAFGNWRFAASLPCSFQQIMHSRIISSPPGQITVQEKRSHSTRVRATHPDPPVFRRLFLSLE